MRVRLLIDVDWPRSNVIALGVSANDQNAVTVTGLPGVGPVGGRFMGAQPVEIEDPNAPYKSP